jgi:hypothetical protein
MQFIEFYVKNKILIMTRPSEIQIRVSKAEIIKSKVSIAGVAFLRKPEIITIHCDCSRECGGT